MLRHVLLTASTALFVAFLACSSDSNDDTPACIELAKKCINDADCCTTKCMWQGDGAYCQQKVAPDPPCSKPGQGCTQNRHCCDGNECIDGACNGPAGSSGTGGCLDDNAECAGAAECCSGACRLDQVSGKRFCGSATFDGGSSGSSGQACGKVGDDCTLPAQCCTNNCVAGKCQLD